MYLVGVLINLPYLVRLLSVDSGDVLSGVFTVELEDVLLSLSSASLDAFSLHDMVPQECINCSSKFDACSLDIGMFNANGEVRQPCTLELSILCL